jgi:hypothetical protein
MQLHKIVISFIGYYSRILKGRYSFNRHREHPSSLITIIIKPNQSTKIYLEIKQTNIESEPSYTKNT